MVMVSFGQSHDSRSSVNMNDASSAGIGKSIANRRWTKLSLLWRNVVEKIRSVGYGRNSAKSPHAMSDSVMMSVRAVCKIVIGLWDSIWRKLSDWRDRRNDRQISLLKFNLPCFSRGNTFLESFVAVSFAGIPFERAFGYRWNIQVSQELAIFLHGRSVLETAGWNSEHDF